MAPPSVSPRRRSTYRGCAACATGSSPAPVPGYNRDTK
jgi:hypothetical protein